MSQSVEITRTVTSSTTTSTLLMNTGYFKTIPGLLKIAQLMIGAICVGIVAFYYDHYGNMLNLLFLLMATSFLIGTFCLLVSCLVSLTTASIIATTIYEIVYHSLGAILLLCASVTLGVQIQDNNYTDWYYSFNVAAALGLINTFLYLYSSFLARRSYYAI